MEPTQTGLPLDPDTLEARARDRLPRMFYDYYAGGAEDEVTLRANRAAYRRLGLRPRVLTDVGVIDTSLDLMGHKLRHPILLAPTAFQRLAHPDGELATARAARRAGAVYVASTLSTCTIEEIAAEAAGLLWFQLYVFRDRGLTREIIARAEAAGASALCLTVTVPVQGRRERDARNRFRLPPELDMANFRDSGHAALPGAKKGSGLEAFIGRNFDPGLGWDVLEWIRSITRLPVLIKGIQAGDDAVRAVENGAAGIIVSNHGGRQLDGALPTVVVLPEVVDAVAGRLPVLVDGGIRRGSDVLKALALGAAATLIGRSYLWGLALAGEDGVFSVLEELRDELVRSMALTGRTRLDQLDASMIVEVPWMT